MNRNRRNRWFFIILAVAIVHQLLQKQFAIYIPFLHAYLDDVLCMPLLLALWAWERKLWFAAPAIKKWEIALLTLLVFILFEGILPLYSSAYTADWRDGLAYSGGSWLYWQLRVV